MWLLGIMILSPSFVVLPGYPALRLEYLIIAVFLLLSFFKIAVTHRVPVHVDGMGLLFILIAVSCLTSIAYSLLFLGEETIINDWFIFVEILLYYTIFRIARSIHGERNDIFRIYNLLFRTSIFVGIFSILQYFNILAINQRLLIPLYFHNIDWRTTSAKLLVENVSWRRIIGTFGNPNYCGMFFAILWAAVISYYLFPIKRRMQLYVLAGAGMGILALIMLTGSRTALLSFVAITVIVLMLGKLTVRKLKSSLVIVFGAVVILSLLVPSYFLRRVFKVSSYSSAEMHVESFGIAFKQIQKSPILGLGPQKMQARSVVDNEYLLYARRYGLIGLLLLLVLHFYPLVKGYRRFSGSENTTDRNLGLLAIQVAIIWVIYGLTSDVFKNPQMMEIVFFLFGLLWGRRAV